MSHIGMSEEKYNYVLELTKALWRVTDLFPCNDVLARLLREKASEIFSCAVEFGYSEQYKRENEIVKARILSLTGFLEIAQLTKVVKPINIIFLSKEYRELQRFLEQELTEENRISGKNPPQPSFAKGGSRDTKSHKRFEERKENSQAVPAVKKEEVLATNVMIPSHHISVKEDGTLNERQKTIIAHIREMPQAKVSDFYELFSKISTKTVQRDLQDLVERNILKKEGEKRWTTYLIVQ